MKPVTMKRLKLIVRRDGDYWLCTTKPWQWAYGTGATPEAAIEDMRVLLREMRDNGTLDDTAWPEREMCKMLMAWLF